MIPWTIRICMAINRRDDCTCKYRHKPSIPDEARQGGFPSIIYIISSNTPPPTPLPHMYKPLPPPFPALPRQETNYPLPTTHSPLNGINQTPLLIPPHHILLHPSNPPENPRPQHAKPRRKHLPRIQQHAQNPKLADEFDEFVHLIEVVLRCDEVCCFGCG